MLFHSYESVHVYLLTLSVAIAGLCTFEAARRHSILWLAYACVACTVAMFCFGSGVATFPAVMILAFALRLPWRWFALPLCTLAFCLFLYLYALPGDQGVRAMLALRPIDSAFVAVDWLSSPWVRGWLGFADPPLDPSTISGLPYQHFGAQLQASANWMERVSGASWPVLARALGFIGVCAFLIGFARLAFRRHAQLTRLQALASMLCLFALATATVISIGRLDYFNTYPDQVYADRYLVWPSLFWTGLVMLLLSQTHSSLERKLAGACLCACMLLPVALLPTQEASAVWGSIVYRNAQQISAASRTGVFDPAIFPDGDDARREDVLRTLALLKQQRMAMFANPSFEQIGHVWAGSLVRSDRFTVDAHLHDLFDDAQTGTRAAHFEGIVATGAGQIQHSGELAVFDSDNRIVGLSEFSYISPPAALIMRTPRKRGFDGYIRDYRPDARYRLVLLPRSGTQAIELCDVGPVPH
ncbi:MAG: hypothetical protein E6K53_03060 [Gammaproteobacteria bacterium]|nr:MAG: hypothetical protein E6K53_03060 [Gammaproteobacteria bacterium]